MIKTFMEISRKLIIILMITILLVFFMVEPMAEAAQLPGDGEFYYAGTQKGTYVVTEGIWAWLLSHLGDIVDWILGFITMGFRMSIVGWTTIFEWLLTRTLESSVGATYTTQALSSTSVILDSVTAGDTSVASSYANDSSSNVTVEAIVYNKVPIFNINFFDFSWDDTVTGTGRDLKILKCKKCKNFEFADATNHPGATLCTCEESKCKCTGCRVRRAYEAAHQPGVTTKNAITIIKETVAEWYYTIRLIAIAAMLCILIVIGIKIGVSSLASEKAVYKRMLVDWLVGFIFLFGIQYVMFFIINLNEILVGIVADYAKAADNTAAQVTKIEFNIEEKSNEDLEISVYEAVRTRAYDPKLINGLTGMVMYLTLVVFAIRFSWMYIKRYFTLIVLTLMAPGVAFSYAIQKVFSGKAKAWSTWLQEYIVNVFIQVVHAILYASFVSMALLVSLNSISGMIVALILMNFMLKADKVFRKIFKMSSDGSLLDRVAKGAEQARLSNISKSVQGAIVGARPMLNFAKHTPGAAMIRTAGSGIKTGAILGGAALSNNERLKEIRDKYNAGRAERERRREQEKIEKATTQNMIDRFGEDGYRNLQNKSSDEEWEKLRETFRPPRPYKEKIKDYINSLNPEEMRPEEAQRVSEKLAEEEERKFAEYLLARSTNEKKKDIKAKYEEYRHAKEMREAFDKTQKIRVRDIVAGKLQDVFNYDRYFEKDKDGKTHIRKVQYKFNPVTGKIETHGSSERISMALKENSLFGTEAEKKATIEAVKVAAGGMVGTGLMFLGLGTIVANPGVGMAMMTYGMSQTGKMLGTNRNINTPSHRSAIENKHYYNMRYSMGALNLIKASTLDMARQEYYKAKQEKKELVKENKGFFKRYMSGEGFTPREGVAEDQDKLKQYVTFVSQIKQKDRALAAARKKYRKTEKAYKKQGEVTEIVDRMYGRGMATEQAAAPIRAIRGFADAHFGGLTEKLDEIAEAQNNAILEQFAIFEEESGNFQARYSKGVIAAEMGKIDKVQAIEDEKKEESTIVKVGEDKRIVYKPLPKNVRDLVKETMAEFRNKDLKDPTVKAQLLKRVAQKAYDLKLDIIVQNDAPSNNVTENMGNIEGLGKLDEDLLAASIQGTISTEARMQIENQINTEILSKINKAVDEAIASVTTEEVEIKEKRAKIVEEAKTPEGFEKAKEEYQITSEERETIAEVVKKQVETTKGITKAITSKEDLEKQQDEIAKKLKEKNGNLSDEEAKLQVAAFMKEVFEEDTVKKQAKDVVRFARNKDGFRSITRIGLTEVQKDEAVSQTVYDALEEQRTKARQEQQEAIRKEFEGKISEEELREKVDAVPVVRAFTRPVRGKKAPKTSATKGKKDSLTEISKELSQGQTTENMSPELIRERDAHIASLLEGLSEAYQLNDRFDQMGKKKAQYAAMELEDGQMQTAINPRNDVEKIIKDRRKKSASTEYKQAVSGRSKAEGKGVKLPSKDDPQLVGPMISLEEMISSFTRKE